jgi:hypothetical protein
MWFGQVMDGLVLVLAVILNPRAERGARRGEQRSRDVARDDPADATSGGTAMAVRPTTAAQGNT